jgi:hypothetical protein
MEKTNKTTQRIDTIKVNSSEMTYQICKFTTIPSRREVRTINTSFFIDPTLQEGWLRHSWQAHNRYNDYFAQRGATRLEKERRE